MKLLIIAVVVIGLYCCLRISVYYFPDDHWLKRVLNKIHDLGE